MFQKGLSLYLPTKNNNSLVKYWHVFVAPKQWPVNFLSAFRAVVSRILGCVCSSVFGQEP